MKTKFKNITTEDKEARKLIRMKAMRALNDFTYDLPRFEDMPYKEVTPEDFTGTPFMQYTISEDPLIQVRVTMTGQYKVEFVYMEQGTGCVLTVTREEWALWLVDHLAEIQAN